MAFSGLVLPLPPPGDSTRVVTAVVTALLLAVAAPPPRVAAVVTTLRDGTTATNGITIVQTVTTTAVTVIATMIAVTAMTAAIVTVSVLATDPAALKTGSAMPRMIARDARMIERDARMIASAVKRSVRPFPMVKIGKVCVAPPPRVLVVGWSAYKKFEQCPWTPFLLLMMSLILLSRSAQYNLPCGPYLRIANQRRSARSLQPTA
jgi:hypothetical protein